MSADWQVSVTACLARVKGGVQPASRHKQRLASALRALERLDAGGRKDCPGPLLDALHDHDHDRERRGWAGELNGTGWHGQCWR